MVARKNQNGTEPNMPAEEKGGHLIFFRHSQIIAETVANFSERIGRVVPAIGYDAETIHALVSDYAVTPNFVPDSSVLSKLTRTVSRAPPTISYSTLLFNQNSIILAGDSNE